MNARGLRLGTAVLTVLLLLGGCESIDTKVDRLHNQAQELAAAGDADRALVSLRALFDLDGEHRDARMLYADLQRDRDNLREAYGHYLLVSEQYPNFAPARVELSEIALASGQWDEVKRHADAAARIEPDNPRLPTIQDALAYQDLKDADDPDALAALLENVRKRLGETPDDQVSRRILIDHLAASGDPYSAIDETRKALEIDPDDRDLNQILLSLLAQIEDSAGLGDQLQIMVERFPDEPALRTALLRWYLSVDDAAGAEAFVRQLVDRSGDEIPPRVALVQFMREVYGPEAAMTETRALIEEGHADTLFRTLLASLQFDYGERDAAIADLQSMVEGADTDENGLNARITLAQMLDMVGKRAQAEPLVAEVLSADSRQVEALKLRASWLIEDDQVRDAVLALRTALDQNPRDPQTMTLLAQAYERDGNKELMGESLALAYEASNAAPAESLQYAQHLIQDDKILTAESVVVRALRLAPTNVELLRTLGGISLELADRARTEQVIATLQQIDTEQSIALATELQALLLQRLQRTDESIALLRNVIEEGKGNLSTQAAIIRTHLSNNDIVQARSYMDELLGSSEDSQERDNILFLNAALLAVEGNFDAARQEYRGLLDRNPQSEFVWRALIATTIREGDPQAAESLVEDALEALPASPTLLWIKAGFAERRGDIDDAIEIYERLYTADSNSTIVANNLASLITTYRDDQESLERAYIIARRLRGTTLPAFQETYGWIAYRLGNLQEALKYLESAAQGLPGDPVARFHLGKTLDALDRPEDAAREYRAALALWGDTENEMARSARTDLANLDADPNANANGNGQ